MLLEKAGCQVAGETGETMTLSIKRMSPVVICNR